MMATRLLGSAHLLRLTHLRGSTLLLGSCHFIHFRNSLLQNSPRLVKSVRSLANNNGLMKIAALLGGIGGLAAGGTYMLESPYISEILLRKGIDKSQCSFQEPSKMAIDRKELQKELKEFLDLDRYQPNPLTRVVFGPRGSGKTAAVMKLLKDKKPVVYVHIRDSDVTDLGEKIHCALSVYVPKGTDPTCLFGTVLQGTSRWYDRIIFPIKTLKKKIFKEKTPQPILVVDFNQRINNESFENILFLLKSWGSDSGWIKPIVILTNTLGLERPRIGLRAEFFKIDDLSEEECALYHEKLCKMKNINANTDQFTLSPERWNRLLYLSTLAQRKISSFDDLKREATQLEEEISDSYEKALISFTEEIERKTYSEHCVLCRLMTKEKEKMNKEKDKEKGIYLKEFREEYGLQEKEIIKILLDIRPRPFYIHPETQEVYIGSRFMMPALERMCKPKCMFTRIIRRINFYVT